MVRTLIRRRLAMLTVALGVALVGAATAAAGISADPPQSAATGLLDVDMPDVAPPVATELNAAQLQDLITGAEQEGISLEEAIERWAWHEPFSMLVNDLRESYPRTFAGARISGDGNPWVAFKGKVPEGAAEAVADFKAIGFGYRSVDIAEDRGFSEAELIDRLTTAHFAAFRMKDLIANVSSGMDIETGEITVEVEIAPGRGGAGADVDVLVAELVRSAEPGALRGVSVEVVDHVRGGNDAWLYGGHALRTCTSGFTVKIGATRALSTAGHCSDDQHYPLSGPDAQLNTGVDYEGPWGDFQYHTSSHYEADDFFAGPYELYLRDVSGTGFPSLDQYLCRNGKSSGKYCDNVYKMFECFNDACGLTAMDNRYGIGGDSGGPWFYGHTAYGIHKGYKWIWFSYRDLFSPVQHMDEALGMTVATS